MGIKIIDIAAFLLNLVYCAYSEHILPCNVTFMEPCPRPNQVCSQLKGQCECKKGFIFVGDDCEAPSPNSDTSHTTTAVILSISTIAILVYATYLFKKYDLLSQIRQRINFRRNNNAAYEDVMIGEDDPPLSP